MDQADASSDDRMAIVDRWVELFNTDVERLVTELYAPDCTFSGMAMTHDQLIKLERRVLQAAPNRRARIDHRHRIVDGVIVEGALLDPDQGDGWSLPFCVVLRIRDGRIVDDNTYADFSRWPGFG